jgi:serine/threonine protein kinase
MDFQVYSGYWRGTKVAIKRMLINNTRVADDGSTLEDFVREANLMSTLRHPNIIQVRFGRL